MNQLPPSASQSVSSLDHIPLLGYPEFSLGLPSHIRMLRLLGYGFVLLGLLLITGAMGYQYLWQAH
ncbi:hypothetical protein O59_003401 [Cellvibrio sp. BR]|uniref:hypothetical protein n=1 Tax=Cellvibrio sp. BR TaxID=1134474 RepID=UPI0002600D59|nr:hypothetical protein [Cellvibrio sp. BR]EIK44320.1 hypothetical protein O59_003401 [Cellvibrio sp. BR]